MTIEPTKHNAIQKAEELLEIYNKESPWLQQFEREISLARPVYDRENDDMDQLDQYPPLNCMEERRKNWAEKIEAFHQGQERVSALASKIDDELLSLRWCSNVPQDIFAKFQYLDSKKASQLQEDYNTLRSKVSILEEHLSSVQKLARTILQETNKIERHSDRRLEQAIQRCREGQAAPSYLSWVGDKISRNAPSLFRAAQPPLKSNIFSNRSMPPSQAEVSQDNSNLESVPPPADACNTRKGNSNEAGNARKGKK